MTDDATSQHHEAFLSSEREHILMIANHYVINTAAQYPADEPPLHWYLRIRTRLVTRAGFEIGSGMTVNPSLPESDADFLNGKKE